MIETLRPFLAPPGTSLKSFWTFQAIFWSFIFFWRILYNFAHGFNVAWYQVGPRIVSLSICALMVLILGHIAARLMPKRLRVERLVLIVGITLLLALFLAMTDRIIFAAFEGEVPLGELVRFDVPKNYFFSAWMFVSWVVLFLLFGQFSHQRERERAIHQLMSSAKEARMQMLMHQLNPHFLFNALNSLSALISEARTADADLMISRLSRFLRHVIDPTPAKLIALDQELEILADYVDIQKVRYGDQLAFIFECADRSVCDALVPKLILQPLFENSIKYGRQIPGHKIEIEVMASLTADGVCLRVEDNGPGFSEVPNPDGLGLSLVRERLEAHFGDEANLHTQTLAQGGSRVEIHMPLRLPDRAEEAPT
nr:histidine kinase [Hyphomonas sp. Mor2]